MPIRTFAGQGEVIPVYNRCILMNLVAHCEDGTQGRYTNTMPMCYHWADPGLAGAGLRPLRGNLPNGSAHSPDYDVKGVRAGGASAPTAAGPQPPGESRLLWRTGDRPPGIRVQPYTAPQGAACRLVVPRNIPAW